MLFFQILLDKSQYLEKNQIKEEFSIELFTKNLNELLKEKEGFSKKVDEFIMKIRKQSFRLAFLSEKQIFEFIKSFRTSQVKLISFLTYFAIILIMIFSFLINYILYS